MHKVLVNTHKESNINILKARDYYFNKARFINNFLRGACLLGPIILSLLGMVFSLIMRICMQDKIVQWTDAYLDFFVGGIAILAFAIDFVLKNKVDMYLSKSNMLRELYDVKVLGIVPNEFYYHYTEQEMADCLQKAKHIKDTDKYEVWYREIFSKDDFANGICTMMDNVIYTYYVYTDNKKRHFRRLLIVLGLFLIYCVAYIKSPVIVNPFVIFVAIFDFIKETIDSYYTSKDLAQNNKKLKDKVVSISKDILLEEDKRLTLRCIQDVIIDNREKGLFIPKRLRDKHLKNDSPFYRELDEVKQIYFGESVEKPQYARDFQICSIENENVLIDFETIHKELIEMLKDIKKCLNKNGISFMLDGGTLIGACREGNGHGFLQWDDDIDIAVKSSDVNRVKELIEKTFADKYEVQDYYNEEYYSPRLATFRIRQKNTVSQVCEKDSALYELYSKKGLFIDVYAYTPILGWKWLDAIYRSLLIYPLNKRLCKVEIDWKIGCNPEKALVKFKKLKEKYIKRANWYIDHAKNRKYVSYEPFYIHDLKKWGPYIKVKNIYGKVKSGVFEGTEYEVPSNSNEVLAQYYGADWEKSPFLSLEDIRKDGVLWYSQAKVDVSCYKHLKKVSIYK